MAKAKDGGYVGVSYARFALLDATTGKALTSGIPGADANGIYKVTTSTDGGVASAALSGLAPSVTRIWGNNSVADISVGKAQPSVALTINFLAHDVLAAILVHSHRIQLHSMAFLWYFYSFSAILIFAENYNKYHLWQTVHKHS